MTAEEMAHVDLRGRMAFAAAVSEGVLAWARSLPTYAGAYFDQATGGNITVLFTQVNEETVAALQTRSPATNLGIRAAEADVTYEALVDAVEVLPTQWPELVGDARLYVAAVDVRANGIRLEVAADDVASVQNAAPRIQTALDVPVVRVDVGAPEVPAASVCKARNNCFSPMKAGATVYKGSGGGCTQGFHVVKNGDYQFLTSGHCGYAGSDDWYHTGYGFLGYETGSVYRHLGDDLMWVQMPNSQASDDIYAASTNIAAMDRPIAGEVVCASLGFSDTVDCGWVTDDFLTYTMPPEYGGFTLYGADHDGIAIGGGDSGSPVYRDLVGDVAIGLVSTASGKFARIYDVLPGSGWLVVT